MEKHIWKKKGYSKAGYLGKSERAEGKRLATKIAVQKLKNGWKTSWHLFL